MTPLDTDEMQRREAVMLAMMDRTFGREGRRPVLWLGSPLAGALPALGAAKSGAGGNGAGKDYEHVAQIALLSPREYSVMLALVEGADGLALSPQAPPSRELAADEMKRRRLFFMDAREQLREALHPHSAENSAGDSPARSAFKDFMRGLSAEADRWSEFLQALEANADQPRAFGVEIFEFGADGNIIAVHDGRGRVEDYYRLS